MAKNPESPLEPFKRALVNATRSLAESPDLEIVYSGEGPQLSGNRAVLPHPPRDLTSIDAARIRGLADQMALRIAHHDPAAHAKTRPASVMAEVWTVRPTAPTNGCCPLSYVITGSTASFVAGHQRKA